MHSDYNQLCQKSILGDNSANQSVSTKTPPLSPRVAKYMIGLFLPPTGDKVEELLKLTKVLPNSPFSLPELTKYEEARIKTNCNRGDKELERAFQTLTASLVNKIDPRPR